MLIIKNELENWREYTHGDDELAQVVRDATLNRLGHMGIDYQVTHKPQRVGVLVIVQDGTREERKAFRLALDDAIAKHVR